MMSPPSCLSAECSLFKVFILSLFCLSGSHSSVHLCGLCGALSSFAVITEVLLLAQAVCQLLIPISSLTCFLSVVDEWTFIQSSYDMVHVNLLLDYLSISRPCSLVPEFSLPFFILSWTHHHHHHPWMLCCDYCVCLYALSLHQGPLCIKYFHLCAYALQSLSYNIVKSWFLIHHDIAIVLIVSKIINFHHQYMHGSGMQDMNLFQNFCSVTWSNFAFSLMSGLMLLR